MIARNYVRKNNVCSDLNCFSHEIHVSMRVCVCVGMFVSLFLFLLCIVFVLLLVNMTSDNEYNNNTNNTNNETNYNNIIEQQRSDLRQTTVALNLPIASDVHRCQRNEPP